MGAKKRKPALPALDPYLAFLIFAGVGLGTLRLGIEVRSVILWATLLGLCLYHAEERGIEVRYSLANLGYGAAVGLIVSLPFALLAGDALRATSAKLFPAASRAALFQSLVFLAAPAEELYFRGFLQRERGLPSAALLYALGMAILFLPAFSGFPLILAAVTGAMGLLGFIYGYVYHRHGLSASIACHVVANAMLFFAPFLLGG